MSLKEVSRKTALVHDSLLGVRGVDPVFLEICDFPPAAVLTPVYDEDGTEGRAVRRRGGPAP